MTEEIITGGSVDSPKQEHIKNPEQQEEEQIELLKLIEEKEPTLWEKDYKDVSVGELVGMINSASYSVKREIVDNLFGKYYDDCEIGRGSNVFIEAPHGKLPSLDEVRLILGQYHRFQDANFEVIEEIFKEIKKELVDVENNSEQTFTKRRSNLKAKCEQDIEVGNNRSRSELKLAILKLFAGSDVYVSGLAQMIAGEEFNYATPGISRKRNDFNKVPGERAIKKGGRIRRLESGHGGALVQHYALEEIMEARQTVDGKFFHILLLERDSRKPFTIGISPYEGEYSCDPEIANLILIKLEKKLAENGVTKDNGKEYEVITPGQGEKFNGSPVNRHRRLGKGKFEGMALGENYNFIQLGIPSLALKKHGDKIAKILQEILEELE